MTRRRRAAGFTLVEVSIAVAILGIFSALATTNYRLYIERVRVVRAIIELKGIALQLDMRVRDGAQLSSTLSAMSLSRSDPWGRPYRFLRLTKPPQATARKDQFLVPLNSDYDLYSLGANGRSRPQITHPDSLDDVVRGANGAFVGLARNY